MEGDRIVNFNSPIIQKNTPIKRLGLSRKRKSYPPECMRNCKIQACSDSFPVSSDRSEKNLSEKESEPTQQVCESRFTNSIEICDEEIEILRKRINEKEEKLKTLQNNKNKIEELENLIELWRTGCKNAFLCFIELLKERQREEIDLKSVLNKLGIREVMIEYFGNDQEISWMDYSQ